MEANKYAFAVAPHKCDAPDESGAYHNCDRGGTCIDNIHRNAHENDYGPGPSFTIDTTKDFHVRQDYHEVAGRFTSYSTWLSQEGREVQMSSGDCDYLQEMSYDMTNMTIIASTWSSPSLDWLQKGSCYGQCNTSSMFTAIKNLKLTTTNVVP